MIDGGVGSVRAIFLLFNGPLFLFLVRWLRCGRLTEGIIIKSNVVSVIIIAKSFFLLYVYFYFYLIIFFNLI